MAGRSGQFPHISVYERLGFPSSNPFPLEVDLNDSLFFIEREDVFEKFAGKLGNAIHLFEQDPASQYRHLLVHGLRGTGKSTIAQQFAKE